MAIKLVKIENGVYTKDGTILVNGVIVDSDADFAKLDKTRTKMYIGVALEQLTVPNS